MPVPPSPMPEGGRNQGRQEDARAFSDVPRALSDSSDPQDSFIENYELADNETRRKMLNQLNGLNWLLTG